eukprot:1987507-Pyramimonas_sp.AAC.1
MVHDDDAHDDDEEIFVLRGATAKLAGAVRDTQRQRQLAAPLDERGLDAWLVLGPPEAGLDWQELIRHSTE